MLLKANKRSFDEAQRIAIYRKYNGICQMCLAEKGNEEESKVSWTEYQADHILPYVKGGDTKEENAQLLCRYHNAQKGGK